MSEKSRSKKKQKVLPPRPPRIANRLSTPHADRPRLESIPCVVTGASATDTHATSAYPTPARMARKPALASDSFGSRAVCVPAPAFQTLATSYSDLQDVGNADMSDSDEDCEKKIGLSSDSGSSDPEIVEDGATSTSASRRRKGGVFNPHLPLARGIFHAKVENYSAYTYIVGR
ncbi:hypothetical protein BDV93DRAFT_514193 [Ceratobasidium sp. AG-I]|nr:hypothetical protein BDV93DRAFT_514193 [Ceratobasidium sp. AG-I]